MAISSSKSLQKIVRIQGRALRLAIFLISYVKKVHNASSSTENPPYRNIQDNFNSLLMYSIFISRASKHPSRIPNNSSCLRPNQVNFGSKSLKAMGLQIWNCLPNELRSADNLSSFKSMIKNVMVPPVNGTFVSIMISYEFLGFASK